MSPRVIYAGKGLKELLEDIVTSIFMEITKHDTKPKHPDIRENIIWNKQHTGVARMESPTSGISATVKH